MFHANAVRCFHFRVFMVVIVILTMTTIAGYSQLTFTMRTLEKR